MAFVEKLNCFKDSKNKTSTSLQVGNVVKEVLLKIDTLLKNSGATDDFLLTEKKEILLRAYMIDKLFNPIGELSNNGDQIINLFDGLDNGTNPKVKNEIYHNTPSIGIFYKGNPIFLNHNYIDALDAENEEVLKNDLINKSLDKYYTKESVEIARESIKKLSEGEKYFNLFLETINGRKLSWNSFGFNNGLEIRVGNDISYGTYGNSDNLDNNKFDGFNFDTGFIVNSFIKRVERVLHKPLESKEKNILTLYGFLSKILDIIWNEGQFLMNITSLNDLNYIKFNERYAKAIKMHQGEIIEKYKNNSLWSELYDDNTLMLIEGLYTILKEMGFYIADFSMKDNFGKKRNYSWLRFKIEDKDFSIDKTFGIGNYALSKEDDYIKKYLGE
ncbi:hypothetical protein H3C61_04655 [Candidatus Gracilibacteria bacterium]|nr:hypothetical protein [Candidatus Gracilibacteria bacterium]